MLLGPKLARLSHQNETCPSAGKDNCASFSEGDMLTSEEAWSTAIADDSQIISTTSLTSAQGAMQMAEGRMAGASTTDLGSPTDYSSLSYALPLDATPQMPLFTATQRQSHQLPKMKVSCTAGHQETNPPTQIPAHENVHSPMTRAKRKILEEAGMRRLRNRYV